MNIFKLLKVWSAWNTAESQVKENNMKGKPWYESLTIIFNSLLIPTAGAVGVTDAGQAWVSAHPAVTAVLTVVAALANIFLRKSTTQPIN